GSHEGDAGLSTQVILQGHGLCNAVVPVGTGITLNQSGVKTFRRGGGTLRTVDIPKIPALLFRWAEACEQPLTEHPEARRYGAIPKESRWIGLSPTIERSNGSTRWRAWSHSMTSTQASTAGWT